MLIMKTIISRVTILFSLVMYIMETKVCLLLHKCFELIETKYEENRIYIEI